MKFQPNTTKGTVDTDTITGGYILVARRILVDFWKRPAFHAKLWLWLLLKANHRPVNMKGIDVKRGQVLTKLKKLSEATGHYAGSRPIRPSVPQVSKALKSFSEAGMIATEKQHRSILITILTYDYYQDPDHYSETKRTQHPTARDILLAKQRSTQSRERQEHELVEQIEHYWKLLTMGLTEASERHKTQMERLVDQGDLPSNAMQTLEEIVAMRKEQ